MKRFTFLTALAMVGALLLVGTPVWADIVGTAHDFSNKNWNPTGEICVVCHTPHNADTSVSQAPLWNHEVTAATFTPYTSATLDATTGQPNGVSKLCLSCHDGTVAIDNFGGTTNGTHFISGGEKLGTDLTNDHPVSFTYDTALSTADGELFDPATHPSSLGGTIADDLLIGGKVECASCHDVHGTPNDHLLLIDNAGSALCLTCHDK